MERILICSDIHRNMDSFKTALEMAGAIDRIIIAGDLTDSPERYRREAGMIPLVMVQGNCDRYLAEELPLHAEFTLEGVRFFVTHGHLYGEPDRLRLLAEAKKRKAQVVIYGHTHKQISYMFEGIRFLNPGALRKHPSGSQGCFAVMTLDRENISIEMY